MTRLAQMSPAEKIYRLMPLTATDKKTLTLMCMGMSVKEIARSLSLSPNTVKKRASRIYTRLKVTSMPQAVAISLLYELVDVDQIREIVSQRIENNQEPFYYAPPS